MAICAPVSSKALRVSLKCMFEMRLARYPALCLPTRLSPAQMARSPSHAMTLPSVWPPTQLRAFSHFLPSAVSTFEGVGHLHCS